MRTQAQIEASKRNGAKSKGPATTEGRDRSSQNAIRHGLTSHKSVVIDGESKEEWEAFEREFLLKFQPRDFVEARMVTEMAICQWRLDRIRTMQVVVINQGMTDQLSSIEEQYDNVDMPLIQAAGHTFRKADLQSLDQHETRLSRRFERALRNYNETRAQFPPQPEPEPGPEPVAQPENAKLENEPKTKIHAINLLRTSASPEPLLPSETPQPSPAPENNPI